MTTVTVDWMNPLNKLRWRLAIAAKLPQVKMLDGRKFKLTYSTGRWGRQVFFEPIPTPENTSLVPRGTFDVDAVLLEGWLDE